MYGFKIYVLIVVFEKMFSCIHYMKIKLKVCNVLAQNVLGLGFNVKKWLTMTIMTIAFQSRSTTCLKIINIE